MLALARNYVTELTETIAVGWNRFWYTPTTGRSLIWLRQLTGAFAFLWLASFSFDLISMFGEHGWISTDVVHQATTDGDLNSTAPGFSHLFLAKSSVLLWITHAVCLAIVAAMVAGFALHITTPLTLLIVLSYIHRAPMITTAFETVLCMLLLYLSLLCTNTSVRSKQVSDRDASWLNNLVARLIQLHLCGFYLLIATSKLGTPDWWSGSATWYLLTDSQHRLANLEFITDSNHIMDFIAHGWVAFELLFPVLIWLRTLRPLVIAMAIAVWIAAAILTGQVGYCLLMAVAHLAFVSRTR